MSKLSNFIQKVPARTTDIPTSPATKSFVAHVSPNTTPTRVGSHHSIGPTGGKVCHDFHVDTSAAFFGVCRCGFPKADHNKNIRSSDVASNIIWDVPLRNAATRDMSPAPLSTRKDAPKLLRASSLGRAASDLGRSASEGRPESPHSANDYMRRTLELEAALKLMRAALKTSKQELKTSVEERDSLLEMFQATAEGTAAMVASKVAEAEEAITTLQAEVSNFQYLCFIFRFLFLLSQCSRHRRLQNLKLRTC